MEGMRAFIMRQFALFCVILGIALSESLAQAQSRDVPYWAAIRVDEAYMRVGPSRDYKIAWVYKRKGLPVKVIRVKDGWRLIEDPAGEQGWVVQRLLTPQRSALVTGENLAPIRAKPSGSAPIKWNAQPGVVGILGECRQAWCEIDISGRSGWIREERLWGAGKP